MRSPFVGNQVAGAILALVILIALIWIFSL